MKMRKRPALYALIAVLGSPLIIATWKVFNGDFKGDVAIGVAVILGLAVFLSTIGNKILDSEEKGDKGHDTYIREDIDDGE